MNPKKNIVARQNRLIAAGLCSCCGDEPLQTKRLGERCAEKDRAYQRARRRLEKKRRTA